MNTCYEIPTVEEYLELRRAAGLCSQEDTIVQTALSHSLCSVIIRGEVSELIGMGRIIGDRGYYYQIVDIAVHPSHKENGLVELIMRELMDYIHQHAPEGAEVLLMADVPGIPLYQKLGFQFTYPHSISLHKTI